LSSSWLFSQMQISCELHELALKISEIQRQSTKSNNHM